MKITFNGAGGAAGGGAATIRCFYCLCLLFFDHLRFTKPEYDFCYEYDKNVNGQRVLWISDFQLFVFFPIVYIDDCVNTQTHTL